jgi:hypothetical protein
MVVINFEDQILPGTFEYALHYLIEHKVDLSAFHAAYKNTHKCLRDHSSTVQMIFI